jgi:hypothetical protein
MTRLVLSLLLLLSLALLSLDRWHTSERAASLREIARLREQVRALNKREAVRDTCVQSLAWKMQRAGMLRYAPGNVYSPGKE